MLTLNSPPLRARSSLRSEWRVNPLSPQPSASDRLTVNGQLPRAAIDYLRAEKRTLSGSTNPFLSPKGCSQWFLEGPRNFLPHYQPSDLAFG